MTYIISCLKIGEKMKLNELVSKESDRQNYWQQMNHEYYILTYSIL